MKELERNIPRNPNWEGSFYERLTEYGEWNTDAFWLLHLDLLQVAESANTDEPIDRKLSYMLLYIQQRVNNLTTAHFSKNDVFEISNIKEEKLYEFKERFDMAILGAVTGELLPESSFDLVNPLVKNA